jgi:predicted esterase
MLNRLPLRLLLLALTACTHITLAFEVVLSKITPKISSSCALVNRRKFLRESIIFSSCIAPISLPNKCQSAEPQSKPNILEIRDPDTYSAVVYIPPKTKKRSTDNSLRLIVLLHGAGNNQYSALYEFTNLGSTNSRPGDHTQLPLALLANNQAPEILADNFVVVAPYVGKGKQGSLYDEPRTKVISFVKWFRRWAEEEQSISINPQKISLFGFSEGSTLAVELATTRLFNAVILASYGFTGTLPKLAIERLQGVPIWVFHSIRDDVYDIQCSKRLVESLVTYQGATDVFDVGDTVKFTKLKPVEGNDYNGGVDRGREHVRSALIASRSEEVYSWVLRQ